MIKQQNQRTSVRAIIVKDDALLVMHRNKNNEEYMSYVGGGVEEGESLEEALVREVSEETTLAITADTLLARGVHPNGSITYFFVCKYISGEPQLRADSEEANANSYGKNLYLPKWLPLEELKTTTLPLYPDSPELKELLHNYIATKQWSKQEIEISFI